MLPRDIWWVRGLEQGRLAVVSRPSPNAGLSAHLAHLRAEGLDVLVSMLQRDEATRIGLGDEAGAAAEVGLAFHHLPTDDFGIPHAFETAGRVIAAVAADIAAGRAAGVHCFAGRGRSPLFAAAVLVKLGESPAGAIAAVSEARGRPIPETDAQRRWVFDYAARRRDMMP